MNDAVRRLEDALARQGARSRREGAETYWTCPLHEDNKPSLAVKAKGDGGVLVHCHPCEDSYESKAYLSALLRELGLSWADISPPKADDSIPGALVAEYRYERADGRYLFSVFRSEPKTFRQGVRVEGTRYFAVEWGLGGIKPVLFRLPQVLAAVDAGQTVYVVEGEEDVLALEGLGVTATCNPGGAGKWTADYTAVFAGSRSNVVVVPDWDSAEKRHRGQQHGLAVFEALTEAGVACEVVRAAAGKDPRDHVNAGHGIDELVPVDASALRGLTTEADDSKALEDERRRRRVRRAVDAEEALAGWEAPPSHLDMSSELDLEDEAITWTVERLHERGTNTLVVAQYKTGKTVLALNLLKRLVDNEDFLGHKTALPDDGRRVAWWNYELTAAQARRWVRELGVEHPERLAHLALRGYALPLQAEQIVSWAVTWLRERDVKVLVIDPFAEAFDGDENDNSEVRVWLQNLNEIKRRAEVDDVFLVVHTGHAQAEEGRERARGASRIEGWKDVGWYYTAHPDSPDLRFLRAFGRDVDEPNFAITYDPLTRQLSRDERSTGLSRGQIVASQRALKVAEIVARRPGITKGDLRAQLGKGGNADKDEWVSAAVQMGLIRTQSGKQRAVHHFPVEQQKFDINEAINR